MTFRLTPDQPKPLSAVRVGATSDARWRNVPKRWREVNILDRIEYYDAKHPRKFEK